MLTKMFPDGSLFTVLRVDSVKKIVMVCVLLTESLRVHLQAVQYGRNNTGFQHTSQM